MRQGLGTVRGLYHRAVNFFLYDDRGASMVEYALLVVLIAIVAFVAVVFAGEQVSDTYSEIGSGLEWAGNQSP